MAIPKLTFVSSACLKVATRVTTQWLNDQSFLFSLQYMPLADAMLKPDETILHFRSCNTCITTPIRAIQEAKKLTAIYERVITNVHVQLLQSELYRKLRS